MNSYIVTVKHDKGTTKITTTATSKDMAMFLVMKAEDCPPSSILEVKPDILGRAENVFIKFTDAHLKNMRKSYLTGDVDELVKAARSLSDGLNNALRSMEAEQ